MTHTPHLTLTPPFDSDTLPPDFFDAIANDMMGHNEEQVIAQIIPSVINATIDLSQLVIDNKKHNSQKMSDKDIYDIYKKSFKTIISTVNEV